MGYVPVRVSTLRGDDKVDFNIYVPVAERQVLYIRQGDSFEGDRLQRLKKKKLKKMFIDENDEKNYQSYIARSLNAAMDKNSGKSMDVRAEVVQGASQASVEEVMENPGNQVTYEAAKKNAEMYMKFLMEEGSAVGAVLKIENSDKNLAHHGVTVATLSIALAQKLGISDPAHLKTLTLGAYLHDLGHNDSGIDLGRKIEAFSKDDLEKYKQHPKIGAAAAQDKKHFDQGVISILMEHEELEDGSGFPNGIPGAKIDKLAKIVGVCNTWDRFVTFEGMSVVDALKHLTMTKLGKYPLDYISALKTIVQS